MYWNISTELGGMSTWGWAQNSLISVDPVNRNFRYNHDYYLLKHMTHYVDIGAKYLHLSGTCDDSFAFVNPDGSMVLLLRNQAAKIQNIRVQTPSRGVNIEMRPNSIGTMLLRT
jgi:glucosylceramidase